MNATTNAAAAGTITIGGDLKVNRLGYGAMRLMRRGHLGRAEGSAERAPRAAAGTRARHQFHRYGGLLRAGSERAPDCRDVASVPAGTRDRDQGRPDPAEPRPMGPARQPGPPAPGLRGEPETAARRAHRSLPVPCARSARTRRGFSRRAGEAAAGGQDPAHRRLELQRGRAGARRRHSEDRLGAESLQRQRSPLGRRHRVLREPQDGVHSVVSARGGRACLPATPARASWSASRSSTP